MTPKHDSAGEFHPQELAARIPALERIRDQLAELRVERGRWSTFRQSSVEDVARVWKDDASVVWAFHDPKLVREDLAVVMLRQDLFEAMHRVLAQLLTGQLAVASESQQVTRLVAVIRDIADKPESVRELAGLAIEHANRLASVFVMPPHLAAPPLPRLSAEEATWLRENLDTDEPDEAPDGDRPQPR